MKGVNIFIGDVPLAWVNTCAVE
ncbi:hypothetical protein Cabther_A1172 [Chloracidobacterium thermophilum B]|uniref:Uncharacterized protein n=1 Tax=Chloracidobacterium thermophilum (strain B) TaxID=981222 RepID=G2LD66_CHLTF|nr:hypothetical protein Cabther_A1172 [Chloracidobacterium thermophilum B]